MKQVNVGVLGHVDSGKTSLCRCLSEVLSTCALDKHRQSKERGITIDLGFSSFYIRKKVPDLKEKELTSENEVHNKNDGVHNSLIQVCLVDCPGHHSLLKCIIMGAEITDLIFLVIDITKGIQKQTIECLVLCEIVKSDIIIILNKIDMIPMKERERKINKMKNKIMEALNKTSIRNLKYYIVAVAAENKHPTESIQYSECEKRDHDNNNCLEDSINKMTDERETNNNNGNHESIEPYTNEKVISNTQKSLHIKDLLDLLCEVIKIPERKEESVEEFYFLYDHCFDIKGKGVVFTGTVIRGTIRSNCNVTILPVNEKGKVKEIQSFKTKMEEGTKGNRVSLLISTQSKNIKKVERGIITYEKSNISHFSLFICKITKVDFYKKSVHCGELFKCIIGFSSALCYGYFFKKMNQGYGVKNNSMQTNERKNASVEKEDFFFDTHGNYLLVEKYGHDEEILEEEKLNEKEEEKEDLYFLAILNKKVHAFQNEMCIFLKDNDTLTCRICFYGVITHIINAHEHKTDSFCVNKKPDLGLYESCSNFKILKEKQKIGTIERIQNDNMVLCKNMFHSASEVVPYINKKIFIIESGYIQDKEKLAIKCSGTIVKSFGTNGKFLIDLDEDISLIMGHLKSHVVLLRYYKDIFTKKRIFC